MEGSRGYANLRKPGKEGGMLHERRTSNARSTYLVLVGEGTECFQSFERKQQSCQLLFHSAEHFDI